jgi:hypothetical protein
MSTVPASSYGIQQQTVAPPPPGGNGSIYSNGAAISANNAQTQNKTKFGGKRGGAATIPVAVVPVMYKETGAGSNTTSANVINSNKTQADLHANKQFDGCVGKGASCGQSGGKRRRRTCKKRNRRGKRHRKSCKRRSNKRNSRGKRSK